VLRVIDPDRLEIVSAVPLSDAARVHLGASARIVQAPTGTPDDELTVESRPTVVEPATGTVPVRLGFAHAISLPVGMRVQTDISAEERRDVVAVPAAAVVHDGDEVAVFVVSAGKAHRRAVQIGVGDGARVEIVSGIQVGDHVIVDGQAGLPDDAPVTQAPGKGSGPAKDGPS
jgi:membrane fusion protein (multidrug efflux system)